MPKRSPSSQSRVETIASELGKACIGVRVRLMARQVSGIYEQQIRESTLTIGQMNMLTAMINIGEEHASASKLSGALCMEKSTVSRNLDKMESQGWIRRNEPTQGRLETLSVTASGRKVYAKAYPGWSKAQQMVVDELGDELVSAIMQGITIGRPKE